LGVLPALVSVDRAGGAMRIVLIDADAELSLAMAVRLPGQTHWDDTSKELQSNLEAKVENGSAMKLPLALG
jgi:hypothetical protein